eukprot:6206912-Pleurochrysis_carterae.AAC.1
MPRASSERTRAPGRLGCEKENRNPQPTKLKRKLPVGLGRKGKQRRKHAGRKGSAPAYLDHAAVLQRNAGGACSRQRGREKGGRAGERERAR